MKYLNMIKKETAKLGREFRLSQSDIKEITNEIIEEYVTMEFISDTWKKLYALYPYMANKVYKKVMSYARIKVGIDIPIECEVHAGVMWIKDVNKRTCIIVNYDTLIKVLTELKAAQ